MEIPPTDFFSINGTTDHADQAEASNIQMEILKRLGGWHPLEVPTLLKLSLSHAITHLPSQKEEPLSVPFELFERCFSNDSLINYLASKEVLIPFLKRLPIERSLSTLKLNDVFISDDECYHFLKAFGKDLHSLHLPKSSMPINVDKLALLVPGLDEIEADDPFSNEQVLQLIKSYPKIKGVGSTVLRSVNVETLRALIQGCTELEEFHIPYKQIGNLENFYEGIAVPALRKLDDWNGNAADSFAFAVRCTNLTYFGRRKIALQDPLINLLTQCTKLTELFLTCQPPSASSQMEKSSNDNTIDLNFPNIRKITGSISLIQKYFFATFPNAKIILQLDSEGEKHLEKFLGIHQNIVEIHYGSRLQDTTNIFKSENFRKVLKIAGSALKFINLGDTSEVTDEDLDAIALDCPNLKRFRCNNHADVPGNELCQLTNRAFVNLFKATTFRSVDIMGLPCDDRAIKTLLKKSRSSLTDLSIIHCPITDKSLRKIAKFGRELTKLCLIQCNQISGEALADMVKWTPNLKICDFGDRLLMHHVALISQRLPNLNRISLYVDQWNGKFNLKEGHQYFPKYIAVDFWDGLEGVYLEGTHGLFRGETSFDSYYVDAYVNKLVSDLNSKDIESNHGI